MRVEAYNKWIHRGMVERWLSHRDMPVPPNEVFSPHGYVVDGIAVGFLFQPPTKQAYIDHIAADPDSDPKRRDRALCKLIETLREDALKAGNILITTLTSIPSMKDRLLRLGFEPHGLYTLYYFSPREERLCLG